MGCWSLIVVKYKDHCSTNYKCSLTSAKWFNIHCLLKDTKTSLLWFFLLLKNKSKVLYDQCFGQVAFCYVLFSIKVCDLLVCSPGVKHYRIGMRHCCDLWWTMRRANREALREKWDLTREQSLKSKFGVLMWGCWSFLPNQGQQTCYIWTLTYAGILLSVGSFCNSKMFVIL